MYQWWARLGSEAPAAESVSGVISIFGHVHHPPGSVPAHEALAVNTCASHRLDDRPEWKRSQGRPRQTLIRQLEVNVGLDADAADAGQWSWSLTHHQSSSPVSEWLSEWVAIIIYFSICSEPPDGVSEDMRSPVMMHLVRNKWWQLANTGSPGIWWLNGAFLFVLLRCSPFMTLCIFTDSYSICH